MLLRFRVSNHLSFREPQELSLVTSSLKDQEAGLIACPPAPRGGVLPAAVIYGPNASGKTNLLHALIFMKQAVTESHIHAAPGGGVPRAAFLLDSARAAKPSRFEIDFVMDGVPYNYGFEASDEAFLSEWLYDFPNARARLLFERGGSDFRFGRSLQGRNRIVSELTKSNSLFLSVSAQMDHKQLTRVFEYFSSIRDIPNLGSQADLFSVISHGEIITDKLIEFLKSIDRNVVNFRLRDVEIPEDEFRRVFGGIYDAVKGEVTPEIGNPYMQIFDRIQSGEPLSVVQLGRKSRGGDPVYFAPGLESAGTLRLMAALGLVFRDLDRGSLFLIDELDASLHTHAAEAVLALFCSPETNPKGAQLIATTHDTNLLNSPLLRRDQIWFTEKDADGATRLYPLTDIRTRKGDDIERAYLQGRYGAIPSDDLVADLG